MPSRSSPLVLLLLVVLVAAATAQLPDRGNQALDLLKAGQTNEAAGIFEALLTDNPADATARAADDFARRWLTRLDREKLKAQLQELYRQHIEYPASIPPAPDRWGKPWSYRVVDLKHIAGTKSQSFVLESPTLGTNSDLRAALNNLAAPFPWKIVSADDKVATFTRPGNPQPVLLSAGTTLDGVTLIQIGDRDLIVCDGDRWLRIPVPKR